MGVTDGLGIRKTIAEKVATWFRGKPEPIERLIARRAKLTTLTR